MKLRNPNKDPGHLATWDGLTVRFSLKRASCIVLCILSAFLVSCTSLGVIVFTKHPEILASKWDVRLTKADTQQIRIPALPIEAYPYLAKFKRLKDVDFYWNGANDAKLWELSTVGLTNLQHIGLLDCPQVTDEGIRAIANIPSIRSLGLEGTSITDAGLELMATQMKLTSVNVKNCQGVTRQGVQKLAQCPSLTGFSFSADGWTELQVLELIDSFKNVTWCGIMDSQGKLNVNLLKARSHLINS